MHNGAPRLFMAAPVALPLLLSLGSASHAGYVVNVTESVGNVVATGSGTIDTTDLLFDEDRSLGGAYLQPDAGSALFGPSGVNGLSQGFFRGISGPSSFGPGTALRATNGTGDFAGILLASVGGEIAVPLG